MSVNRVTLVGRLGKDPEVRFTSGGQAVANFSLATDESYKNKEGEKVKKTEWHRIVIWGKLAEIVQQYLNSGSLIYLEGRIQTKKWIDKKDVERYDKEIICDTMKMLGGNNCANGTETEERPAAKKTNKTVTRKAAPKQEEPEEQPFEASDEDIPF